MGELFVKYTSRWQWVETWMNWWKNGSVLSTDYEGLNPIPNFKSVLKESEGKGVAAVVFEEVNKGDVRVVNVFDFIKHKTCDTNCEERTWAWFWKDHSRENEVNLRHDWFYVNHKLERSDKLGYKEYLERFVNNLQDKMNSRFINPPMLTEELKSIIVEEIDKIARNGKEGFMFDSEIINNLKETHSSVVGSMLKRTLYHPPVIEGYFENYYDVVRFLEKLSKLNSKVYQDVGRAVELLSNVEYSVRLEYDGDTKICINKEVERYQDEDGCNNINTWLNFKLSFIDKTKLVIVGHRNEDGDRFYVTEFLEKDGLLYEEVCELANEYTVAEPVELQEICINK